MPPPSSFFLFLCNVIFLLNFIVLAGCTSVYYVADFKNCTNGCDFLDPYIWTPSPPSTGDDVSITTTAPISLSAVNLSLSLSSLTFGVQNSADVVLVLEGSNFSVSSKVAWGGQSKLTMTDSNLNVDSIRGPLLSLTNGHLNANLAHFGHAKIEASRCMGDNWNITNGNFSANSSFSFASLVALNLTSDESTWVVNDTFQMMGSSTLTGGSLTVGSLLISGTVSLFSTPAHISVLTFSDSPSSFSVDGSDAPTSVSVDSLSPLSPDCTLPVSQRNRITLNASVMATFASGAICNLSVSDDVTLNFGPDNFDLYGIQQVDNTSLQINIMSSQFTLHEPLFLNAQVSLAHNAVLRTGGDFHISGNITGEGKLYASESVVTAEYISISEIHMNGTGGITAQSIDTSYLSFESLNNISTYSVNAPSVRISNGPGIFVQSNNFIYFVGNLSLANGQINVGTKVLVNFTTPYIVVNGNVKISNTSVTGDIPENAKKLFIVQSLSKQLLASDYGSAKHSQRVTVSPQYLVLERNISPVFAKYLPLTLVFVGGLPFVCAAAIVISILKYNRKYARLQ